MINPILLQHTVQSGSLWLMITAILIALIVVGLPLVALYKIVQGFFGSTETHQNGLDYEDFPNAKARMANGEPSGTEGIRLYENGYVQTLEYERIYPPRQVDWIEPNELEGEPNE